MKSALPLATCLALGTLPVHAVVWTEARALLEKYCFECHNAEDKDGHLDLEQFESEAALFREFETMEDLHWVLEEKEMPPSKAEHPLGDEERLRLMSYLERSLLSLSNAKPKDPGVVPMPRVNPDEFDYIVEDLTGYDLQLGQYLTPDGASEQGFVHFGALQTMSVGQFEGFLSTAKKLLGYARVVPKAGITWSSVPLPPADQESEMKKSILDGWVRWHEEEGLAIGRPHQEELQRRFGSSFEPYLEAAWQYLRRRELGKPNATIEEIAAAYPVPLFPSSVAFAVELLEDPRQAPGFPADSLVWAEIRRRVAAIEAPKNGDLAGVRERFKEIARFRAAASFDFDGSFLGELMGRRAGNKPLQQELRGTFHRGEPHLLIDLAASKTGEVHLAAAPVFSSEWNPSMRLERGVVKFKNGSEKPWHQALSLKDQDGRPVTADASGTVVLASPGYLQFKVPAGATLLELFAKYETAGADPEKPAAVRMGAFSKPPENWDTAFVGCQMIGTSKPAFSSLLRRNVHLFETFDYAHPPAFRRDDGGHFAGLPPEVLAWAGVEIPSRLRKKGAVLLSFEAPEIRRFAREESKANLASMLTRMEALAASEGLGEPQLEAEASRIVADLALKLWRRLPTPDEGAQLLDLYRGDRKEGRSFDAATKTALTAVLISPEFLYRFTRSKGSPEPYLLSDVELATRLAYTLWARVPDRDLLKLAYQGQIKDAKTYPALIDRMIDDSRAAAFIEQFAGMWLGFAGFDQFTGPDAEKFKSFDPALREAMHQEAALFFLDLLRSDRPVTDALVAKDTFLNERLAAHYGIDGVEGPEMRRVELKDTSQRGGILSMGAFLTKTSTPLRTSPVHRGIWVYENILGLPIPEPPPNVPQLSDDEKSEDGLTVAQQLELHREKPDCSSCHEKFDPLGVALENFDPTGAWRTTTAGEPVDAAGRYKSGKVVNGLEDLRKHVLDQRPQFLRHFCENLLAYCLGRDLLPTDKPTVEDMLQAMNRHNLTFRSALHTALASPQYLHRRDATAAR